MYTQRDKIEDKVWPKGTVETMHIERDILGKTIIALYKKIFPNAAGGQIPTVHEICIDMGCLGPKGSPLRSICQIHEAISDGIMRLRYAAECPWCSEELREGEDDTLRLRKTGWAPPQTNADLTSREPKDAPQSKFIRYPSQTPHRSPLVSLKQEQEQHPHEFPPAASSAMRQYFSAVASQSGRVQDQQRPAVLNGGMRRHISIPHGLAVNDPPTPSYSPVQEGAWNDSLIAFDPDGNPYLPHQCQYGLMGSSLSEPFLLF